MIVTKVSWPLVRLAVRSRGLKVRKSIRSVSVSTYDMSNEKYNVTFMYLREIYHAYYVGP